MSSGRRAEFSNQMAAEAASGINYDLIEWIAQQPWCNGNVGMAGISGFGAGNSTRPNRIRRI
jgi:predicted acyl esterase